MAGLLMGGADAVYLHDLHVYRPPEAFKTDQPAIIQMWRDTGRYAEEDIDFQQRVFAKSGLSPCGTYLPPALNPRFVGNDAKTDITSAMEECRMATCGAVEGLLKKTGLAPSQIDILVTTCSIFCPTPSMASMLVNHFGMKPGVQSYHLGGMGCANGVVAVNMVADLLKAHPHSTALLVTTETTTPAYYRGNDRHRLVANLLFRMGGAAMLFSNRPTLPVRPGPPARPHAGPKYVLLARHRVHLGQSDDALNAIRYGPDAAGHNGIYLGKEVVKEASKALTTAMTKIAPCILTWRQLGEAAVHALRARAGRPRGAASSSKGKVDRSSSSNSSGSSGSGSSAKEGEDEAGKAQAGTPVVAKAAADVAPTAAAGGGVEAAAAGGGGAAPRPRASAAPYRPNFRESTISHFLLHAGGAKVLDGLGEALQLDEARLGPSRAVLHDYGNVSSSTTWYTLACVETVEGVRSGARVLQIGVGSGIKCGVNVWKALRDVREVHPAWRHRLDPAEAAALELAGAVDVRHGWAHVALRLVFVLLMVGLVGAMHAVVLAGGGQQGLQGGGGGGGARAEL